MVNAGREVLAASGGRGVGKNLGRCGLGSDARAATPTQRGSTSHLGGATAIMPVRIRKIT